LEQLTAEFGGAAVTGAGVGPVLEKFSDVSKIAVLRGGGLGDVLFAMPAMAALKAAYPGSTLTLLGTPLHAALVAATEGPVDEVQVLPFAEGVRPGDEDEEELERFFARARQEQYDLAVQLHGGGRYSNPFLLRLGARHTVGTRTPDAHGLERTVPYIYYQHEPLRALEVAGFAGAAPVELEPRLRPLEEYRRKAEDLVNPDMESLVVIHPGATDPRRRWPVERFAAVAAAAVADGSQVLVVGDSSEQDLAASVVELAVAGRAGRGAVASVAGQLDIGLLAALLERCDVVVANDSGPRHLALAVGTPTVGVFWAGNVINAGALGRSLHRIHPAWVTNCPVCGVDVTQVGWTAERCEHDDSFVATVQAEDVYADVRMLRATSPLLRGR
jgi:ADP-heptose:LPS heptosyltransferase